MSKNPIPLQKRSGTDLCDAADAVTDNSEHTTFGISEREHRGEETNKSEFEWRPTDVVEKKKKTAEDPAVRLTVVCDKFVCVKYRKTLQNTCPML